MFYGTKILKIYLEMLSNISEEYLPKEDLRTAFYGSQYLILMFWRKCIQNAVGFGSYCFNRFVTDTLHVRHKN